jgi:hypothetical protein
MAGLALNVFGDWALSAACLRSGEGALQGLTSGTETSARRGRPRPGAVRPDGVIFGHRRDADRLACDFEHLAHPGHDRH